MLPEEKIYQEALDEVCKQKISSFLTKSRMDVILTLAGNRKLNHGDLATALSTSVASLSNRLVKFNNFEYKLIDSNYEGKFRYYFLTDLCKRYLESCNQDQDIHENIKIVQHEELQLKQKINDVLEEIKSLYEDEWEIELEDALLERMECQDIRSSKGEELADEFIIGIEKLLLYDSEKYSMMILEMLAQNSILQARLTRFMERFEAFIPILKAGNNEENLIGVFDRLANIVRTYRRSQEEKEQKTDESQEDKLFDSICFIIKRIEHLDKQDINNWFMRYMAGNKVLSAFMTQIISRD
mgnify:FL=1